MQIYSKTLLYQFYSKLCTKYHTSLYEYTVTPFRDKVTHMQFTNVSISPIYLYNTLHCNPSHRGSCLFIYTGACTLLTREWEVCMLVGRWGGGGGRGGGGGGQTRGSTLLMSQPCRMRPDPIRIQPLILLRPMQAGSTMLVFSVTSWLFVSRSSVVILNYSILLNLSNNESLI